MSAHDDTTSTRLARIDERTEYITKAIAEIKEELRSVEKKYVTKSEFLPVARVVYGMVAIFLTSVVGAIIALILE